jgi:invasion protein IalB
MTVSRARFAFALSSTFLCLARPAFAQTAPGIAPEPSVTTATFGDWTMRCARDGADPRANLCEVTQTLVAQGQSTPFAQIAIGRIAPKAPLKLTIVLPVNIAFDRVPQVQVSEQPATAINLAWRRCAPLGCFADLEIKAETLTLWRSTVKPGQILFRNAANQEATLPLSFRGLAQALDAMPKG